MSASQTAFESRDHAGRMLAEKIARLNLETPLVMAIPSGGLPVAKAIADIIGADLDVAPQAFSTEEGAEFAAVTADTWSECARHNVKGRIVVLVDDWIATGAASLATARRFRDLGAERIVIASPVISQSAILKIEKAGFDVAFVQLTENTGNLESYFEDAEPVKLAEVESIRQAAAQGLTTAIAREANHRHVELELGDFHATARLHAPSGAPAVVLSIGRDTTITRSVRDLGVATMTCDLSDASGDVAAQARLVRQLIVGAAEQPELIGLPIALVVEGDLASAALEASASVPERVRALIINQPKTIDSQTFLLTVMAPTLFIAPEGDPASHEIIRHAMAEMSGEKALMVVSNREETISAIHNWLERHLKPSRPERGSSVHQTIAQ